MRKLKENKKNLCWKCNKFNPDDKEKNCKVANLNHTGRLIILECPEWEPIPKEIKDTKTIEKLEDLQEEEEWIFRSAKERRYGEIKKILHTAIILYKGWEMDNKGWVVEMEDGSIKAFTTSHGGLYPWEMKELIEKINETLISLQSLETAYSIIW